MLIFQFLICTPLTPEIFKSFFMRAAFENTNVGILSNRLSAENKHRSDGMRSCVNSPGGFPEFTAGECKQ